MSPGRTGSPPLARTTALVARALGVSVQALVDGFTVARADDLDDVVAFRRDALGWRVPWDDARYLAWRYGLQAAARAYGTLRVLRLHGRIVATIGAEEFTVRRGTRAGRAACPMDLLVDAGLHDAGLGVWLNLALADHYPLLLALGANENSAGLIGRLYRPVPGRTVHKFPLDARPFVGRRARSRTAGVLIGAVVNAGLLLRLAVWRLRAARSRLRVRVVPRFESTWDERLAAMGAGATGIVRSADYLNWRFVENPRARFVIVAAFDPADRLHAYAVYRAPERDRSVHVQDWGTADGAADDLRAVTTRVVAAARASGAPYVSATALGAPLDHALSRSGFVRRANERRITAVQARDPEHAELADGDWYLTDLGDDVEGSFETALADGDRASTDAGAYAEVAVPASNRNP
jgi:hypothetical protein